jgi:hypothetical protein
MVRSSGSPLSQQALAQPYQDARSTIDRGSSLDTVIGAGSRLDNLVQIGHNVILGRCCVIVAQVGISGSTVLEDFVRVGGQAAMAGHLRIGQGAGIGAQAGVMSDLVPGAEVLGSPAQPKRDFFRQIVMLKRMAKGEGSRSLYCKSGFTTTCDFRRYHRIVFSDAKRDICDTVQD